MSRKTKKNMRGGSMKNFSAPKPSKSKIPSVKIRPNNSWIKKVNQVKPEYTVKTARPAEASKLTGVNGGLVKPTSPSFNNARKFFQDQQGQNKRTSKLVRQTPVSKRQFGEVPASQKIVAEVPASQKIVAEVQATPKPEAASLANEIRAEKQALSPEKTYLNTSQEVQRKINIQAQAQTEPQKIKTTQTQRYSNIAENLKSKFSYTPPATFDPIKKAENRKSEGYVNNYNPVKAPQSAYQFKNANINRFENSNIKKETENYKNKLLKENPNLYLNSQGREKLSEHRNRYGNLIPLVQEHAEYAVTQLQSTSKLAKQTNIQTVTTNNGQVVKNKNGSIVKRKIGKSDPMILTTLLTKKNNGQNAPRITRIDASEYTKDPKAALEYLTKQLGVEDAFLMHNYLLEKIAQEKPKDKKAFVENLLTTAGEKLKENPDTKRNIEFNSTKLIETKLDTLGDEVKNKLINPNVTVKDKLKLLSKTGMKKEDIKQLIKASLNYNPVFGDSLNPTKVGIQSVEMLKTPVSQLTQEQKYIQDKMITEQSEKIKREIDEIFSNQFATNAEINELQAAINSISKKGTARTNNNNLTSNNLKRQIEILREKEKKNNDNYTLLRRKRYFFNEELTPDQKLIYIHSDSHKNAIIEDLSKSDGAMKINQEQIDKIKKINEDRNMTGAVKEIEIKKLFPPDAFDETNLAYMSKVFATIKPEEIDDVIEKTRQNSDIYQVSLAENKTPKAEIPLFKNVSSTPVPVTPAPVPVAAPAAPVTPAPAPVAVPVAAVTPATVVPTQPKTQYQTDMQKTINERVKIHEKEYKEKEDKMKENYDKYQTMIQQALNEPDLKQRKILLEKSKKFGITFAGQVDPKRFIEMNKEKNLKQLIKLKLLTEHEQQYYSEGKDRGIEPNLLRSLVEQKFDEETKLVKTKANEIILQQQREAEQKSKVEIPKIDVGFVRDAKGNILNGQFSRFKKRLKYEFSPETIRQDKEKQKQSEAQKNGKKIAEDKTLNLSKKLQMILNKTQLITNTNNVSVIEKSLKHNSTIDDYIARKNKNLLEMRNAYLQELQNKYPELGNISSSYEDIKSKIKEIAPVAASVTAPVAAAVTSPVAAVTAPAPVKPVPVAAAVTSPVAAVTAPAPVKPVPVAAPANTKQLIPISKTKYTTSNTRKLSEKLQSLMEEPNRITKPDEINRIYKDLLSQYPNLVRQSQILSKNNYKNGISTTDLQKLIEEIKDIEANDEQNEGRSMFER